MQLDLVFLCCSCSIISWHTFSHDLALEGDLRAVTITQVRETNSRQSFLKTTRKQRQNAATIFVFFVCVYGTNWEVVICQATHF
jgi:hypothetical protein